MIQAFGSDATQRGARGPIRAFGPLADGRRGLAILNAIHGRLARGARAITVDLSDVPFLDGGGIGLLLRGRATALRRGASFRIAGAAGQARHALLLAGLLGPLEGGASGPAPPKDAPGQDAPVLLSA